MIGPITYDAYFRKPGTPDDFTDEYGKILLKLKDAHQEKETGETPKDLKEGDKITLQEIFAYKMEGYDQNGKVLGDYEAVGGIPSFYRELQQRGIGVDISIFR